VTARPCSAVMESKVGGGDGREVERTAARYVQCLYIAQAANSHSPGTVSLDRWLANERVHVRKGQMYDTSAV